MSEEFDSFREKMRENRLANGWTQQDLADKVDMHVTAISHIETGRREPLLTKALWIGDTLGLMDIYF